MPCRCRLIAAAHDHMANTDHARNGAGGAAGVSLNGQLELAKTRFWNCAQPLDVAVRVLDPASIEQGTTGVASSDADEELMVMVAFSEFVRLRGMSILGTADGHSPTRVQLFSNRNDVTGFDTVRRMHADEEVALANVPAADEIIYHLNAGKFLNTSNLVLFFDRNAGGEDSTHITKIQFFGEATGRVVDRPLATNVVYEAWGVPKDHPVYEDQKHKSTIQ